MSRTRPHVNRHVRALIHRLLLAVVVAIGVLLSTGGPASASPHTPVPSLPTAPWDCTTPPTPAMPDTGLPGALDPAPTPAPPKGDPWAAQPSTSIYDQYGYAGLTWSTYDLGCMGGLGDVNATLDTTIGNFFLSGGAWIASATNGIHNKVANPNQYMAPLDAVVATITSRLHDAIWSPWGIASLLGVAALLLFYSMSGRLSSVVSGAAWALLVLAVLSGISQYPTRVAGFFDEAVSQSIASVNQAGAGLTQTPGAEPTRAQGALVVDGILYKTWLRGELGDSEGPAAERWGPTLFRESAFSRSEAATATAQPDGMQKLAEQKNNDWVATAGEIKDHDPVAYANLQGKTQGRAGAGLLAFLGVLFTAVFRLVADLFVFTGLVMLRLLVMFFPAAAVFGVIAPMASIVRRIGNIAGASIVNVVAFGAGSAVHAVIVSAILTKATSTGMGILALVLCLVVTLAAFILLMPLLSLTSILGHSPARGHRMLGWARRTATDYFVSRKAVEDGTKNADEHDRAPEQPPGAGASNGFPVRRINRVNLPAESFARPPTPSYVVTESTQRPVPEHERAVRSSEVPADRQLPSATQGGRSEQPAAHHTERERSTGVSGVRQPLYDPAARSARREPLVGTLVTEVPPEARVVTLHRSHDSHAEVTREGVGTRFYDPGTKQATLEEADTAGGRHE